MKLVIADGFFARLVGWMGRERLPQDQALWLVPCRAVHTLGMRCALDLVFLDRHGRILRVDPAVLPWRIRGHLRAHSVLEMAPGGAARLGLAPGGWVRRGPAGRLLAGGLLAMAVWVSALSGVTLPVPARAAPPLLDEGTEPIVFDTEWTVDGEQALREGSWTAGIAPMPLAPVPPLAPPSRGPSSPPGAAMVAPVRVSAARAVLPPLRLVRPLAPATLERLLDEAESLYQGRQWEQAVEAFSDLVEWDPGRRQAWLRLGNLHHQRQRLEPAAAAYQRAAAPASAQEGVLSGVEASARAKALANLIALNLATMREALGHGALSGEGARSGLADFQREARRTLDQLQADPPAEASASLPAAKVSPWRAESPAPGAVDGGSARRPTVEYLRDPPGAAGVPSTPRPSWGR